LLGINKAALFAAFPLSDVCLFGAQLPARDSFCLLYANLPAWDSLCLLGDGAIALVSSAYDCLFGDGATFALVSPARDCLFGDGATFALVSPTRDCLFGDGSTLELVLSLAEHTVEVDRASTRPAPRERPRA